MNRTRLPTVLACGAWLKNAACLLVEGRPVWSVVHGDLSDPQACVALENSVDQLLAQHAKHGGPPVAAVAHDLHPDFFSTRLALRIAGSLDVPAVGVQHHHAHIAAVAAEHSLDVPVIGLALDGVGLGTDGRAWGGELLWVHGSNWQRLGHLRPLALPGGDRAALEPWRMAASVLHQLGRGDEIVPRFARTVGELQAGGLQQMLVRGLNCPPTSSAGRWFDAAAAALGLCQKQTAEAEAAIALESAATRWLAQHLHTQALPGAAIRPDNQLDLLDLMPALLEARADEVDAAAAGFHLALADGLADWAARAARHRGVGVVCLGGGCFFNRVLRERVMKRLAEAGLATRLPGASGCGDAGLALGQAWVVAQQLVCGPTEPMKKAETCV